MGGKRTFAANAKPKFQAEKSGHGVSAANPAFEVLDIASVDGEN